MNYFSIHFWPKFHKNEVGVEGVECVGGVKHPSVGDSFFQHLHPKRTIRARGSSKHLKYLDTNLRVYHRSTFSKFLLFVDLLTKM